MRLSVEVMGFLRFFRDFRKNLEDGFDLRLLEIKRSYSRNENIMELRGGCKKLRDL
ncbi:MAG: hypothetical protein ABIM20_01545 [candidate division WOR-3 bacterium]